LNLDPKKYVFCKAGSTKIFEFNKIETRKNNMKYVIFENENKKCIKRKLKLDKNNIYYCKSPVDNQIIKKIKRDHIREIYKD